MIVSILLLATSLAQAHPKFCSYSYSVWNSRERRGEGPYRVSKLYTELGPHERGPRGCSVCDEDQVPVRLSNGVTFKVCGAFVEEFRSGLEAALLKGEVIETVIGYRPSKSRGNLDGQGRRTEFSNHAYGAALDLNEAYNGLYDNCVSWSLSCRLIKGGRYAPGQPRSWTSQSPLVRALRDRGFAWGGEISGKQKDFMHFSPDGL